MTSKSDISITKDEAQLFGEMLEKWATTLAPKEQVLLHLLVSQCDAAGNVKLVRMAQGVIDALTPKLNTAKWVLDDYVRQLAGLYNRPKFQLTKLSTTELIHRIGMHSDNNQI